MKHWVFDLDGTLIDSAATFEVAIFQILKEFGFNPTAADMAVAYQFFNPADFFAKYLTEPDQINLALNRLLTISKEQVNSIRAFDQIEQALILLKQLNVKVSVWTGRELVTTKSILKNIGFEKYLDHCVSRSCVERTKPYPDGLLKILMDSRDHGDDVMMVGDHQYDIQGARAAGVRAISVDWHSKAPHPVHGLADFHFTDISDFINWIKEYYSKEKSQAITL